MITQTLKEWLAEGMEKFGGDIENWKFKCPACGHVALGLDDLKYYVYDNCIDGIAF